MKGLWESTRGQWSGDADLNNGKLSMLYDEYKERLAKASTLGLDTRSNPLLIEINLNAVRELTWIFFTLVILFSLCI